MTRLFGCLWVCCLLLCLSTSTTYAAEYDVNQDGTGDFAAIQAAINAAVDGDVIVVHPGSYYENIHFDGKNITLRSTAPQDQDIVASTVIDGGQKDSVVTLDGTEDETCLLSGFTITNGKSTNQGGGGGVRGLLSSEGEATRARISNCTISGNAATGEYEVGGGGLISCNGTITNCTISANSAESTGGGLSGCGADISNCTISGNWVNAGVFGFGGGLYGCDGTISNCTISGNSATGPLYPSGGGLYACSGTITNCIIWGNEARSGPELFDCWGDVTYCCVQGGWTGGGGEGNISADPLFVSGPLGNYYLSSMAAGQGADSPCIDRGNGTAESLGLAGFTTRTDEVPDTGRVDMGYHYPPPLKEWTLVVYLCANNSLSDNALDSLNQLEAAMGSADAHVLVLIDQQGDNNTRAYEVQYDPRGAQNAEIVSTEIPLGDVFAGWEGLTELDLARPETLLYFSEWALNNYPARRLGLVLWDHGNGWFETPTYDRATKCICSDGDDYMQISELKSALISLQQSTGKTFNLIGMDACLMGMVEVAYELRAQCEVFVASEESIPGGGWDYSFISEITKGSDLTAKQLAVDIVDYYYASYTDGLPYPTDDPNIVLSAVDTSAFETGFVPALNDLSRLLIASMQQNSTKVRDAYLSSYRMIDYYFYVDFSDFMHAIANQNISQAVSDAALSAASEHDSLVFYHLAGAGLPRCFGLSIYFQPLENNYDDLYDGSSGFLDFTADTLWDEVIRSYYLDPHIECSLNASEFAPGDTLVGSVEAQNPGAQVAVDAYIAFVLPDGGFISLTGTGAASGMHPWVTNILLPSGFGFGPCEVVRTTVPDCPGSYLFAAALTKPGQLKIIGDPSLYPFTIRE